MRNPAQKYANFAIQEYPDVPNFLVPENLTAINYLRLFDGKNRLEIYGAVFKISFKQTPMVLINLIVRVSNE